MSQSEFERFSNEVDQLAAEAKAKGVDSVVEPIVRLRDRYKKEADKADQLFLEQERRENQQRK